MHIIAAIREFRGPYRFLSNYAPSPIVANDGFRYPTVEHAFAAAKTLDVETRLLIGSLPTPGDAKRFGRRVKLREDWKHVEMSVMRELLELKFTQNPLLETALLDTGDSPLIEGNTWDDTFWGADLTSGRGANHLGKLLMEIRAARRALRRTRPQTH